LSCCWGGENTPKARKPLNLNKTIAKLKTKSSKSPNKRQKLESDHREQPIDPDNFPFEEIVGEEFFSRPVVGHCHSRFH
jgi:hypothetical protein